MSDTAIQRTLTPALREKQEHCRGCRDDFYNHEGHSMNGSYCWSLDDAEVVTRYRLHWWTAPTSVSAFQKITTLSCHYEPGQFAFYKELPAHLRGAK